MEENCKESNFELRVSHKKDIRFKAGADVSSSVNKMDVDVTEDRDEKFETLTVKLSLGQQRCEKVI